MRCPSRVPACDRPTAVATGKDTRDRPPASVCSCGMWNVTWSFMEFTAASRHRRVGRGRNASVYRQLLVGGLLGLLDKPGVTPVETADATQSPGCWAKRRAGVLSVAALRIDPPRLTALPTSQTAQGQREGRLTLSPACPGSLSLLIPVRIERPPLYPRLRPASAPAGSQAHSRAPLPAVRWVYWNPNWGAGWQRAPPVTRGPRRVPAHGPA